MRVLLSDGSGLTARQVATILGRRGHHVEAVSSDPLALVRFTRYVRRVHRLPPFGPDPLAWFDAMDALVRRSRFDLVLPTQEQVGVLSLRSSRLRSIGVGVPAPTFQALRRVQDKISAASTLAETGLAQPPFVIARDLADANSYDGPLPVFLKAPIGTASSAVRLARNHEELLAAVKDLARSRVFEQGGLVMQAKADGPLAMIQSVYQQGRVVAAHANARVLEGAGGGAAVKRSIEHETIRSDLARLGETLDWNGALSIDAILTPDGPRYIDVNPRIVEPMNALIAGVDLVGALVSVATGKPAAQQPSGRAGVRTHQALLALLGSAETGRRRDVLATMWDLISRRGVFAGSTEELTPVTGDPRAVIPVTVVGAAVLAYPPSWRAFSVGAVSRYSLTSEGWGSLVAAAQREAG